MSKEALKTTSGEKEIFDDWSSQFPDANHQLVFSQVTRQMENAGVYFRSQWFSTLLDSGFLKVLMDSYWNGSTLLKQNQGNKYTVQHLGSNQDQLGQPIDVFKVVEVSEGQTSPHINSMTIATLREKLHSFTQPVGLSFRFAGQDLKRLDLHYRGKQIVRTQVIGDPDTFFPTTRTRQEGQYICFDLTEREGIKTLTVEAGYENDHLPVHSYVNVAGYPLASEGVRVKGDFMEFIDVETNSNPVLFNSSHPVWLPGIIDRLTGPEGNLKIA